MENIFIGGHSTFDILLSGQMNLQLHFEEALNPPIKPSNPDQCREFGYCSHCNRPLQSKRTTLWHRENWKKLNPKFNVASEVETRVLCEKNLDKVKAATYDLKEEFQELKEKG